MGGEEKVGVPPINPPQTEVVSGWRTTTDDMDVTVRTFSPTARVHAMLSPGLTRNLPSLV